MRSRVCLLGAIAILAGIIFATSAYGLSPDTLITPGVLTVGTAVEYPPFEFTEDGELKGFDVDLATALAEHMDLDCEIKVYTAEEFDSMFGLLGTELDMLASAVTIAAPREPFMDFSDSYYSDPWQDSIGFAFEEGNTALRDSANAALAEMRADGSYEEIYAKWFGENPVAGANRFDTAVAVSQESYPWGFAPDATATVVVATGRDWPDALGGTALAGALDGPVLLVDTESVPDAVMTEIGRLGAKKAVILGGTGAVSAAVQEALEATLGAGEVERIAGANRYETADAVGARVIEALGEDYGGTAFVATGGNFPDALAAAPLAAGLQWPLFLAHPSTGLSDETKAAMADVTDVVILGGEGAVSAATEADLKSSRNVVRLAGADRYATAALVAEYAVDQAGRSWDRVGITTGADFPDALAGGVLQAKAGSVMLLTPATTLGQDARAAIVANKAEIRTVTFLGGTGAVSEDVRAAVAQLLE